MDSQWTHEGQERTKNISRHQHRRHEIGEKQSILLGYRTLCFQNQCCNSIKEWVSSTEVLREHNEVNRQGVRSGKALEWNRNHSSEQLRFSLRSALLNGKNIPKRSKIEIIVSQSIDTNVENGFVKILCKSEVKVEFATSSSFEPKQAW